MRDLTINIHHVTRVEGHGNIKVNIKNGVIEELNLEIVESPRFFEAMLRGRRWDEAAHITSRICGICAVGHTTTSLRATEAAFGLEPSEQTVLLRKLIFNGEMMQSHILHFYFLVAPDFFGMGSVIPLASSHPAVVQRALRLKKLANDVCAVVGGRHIHPISMVVNGFTRIPKPSELREMRQHLVDAWPDLQATVDLFSTLSIPDFERQTEYVSLTNTKEYAFYDGVIASGDGGTIPVSGYKDKIKESVVPHSTAKHASATRESYMVGALSRVNNNYEQLLPKAKEAARALGLKVPCYNPFMISIAQLVETIHCLEDSINIIDSLLSKGLKEEDTRVQIRAGTGVGACEVPRGTLYHEYTFDEQGLITAANLIIPTAQNVANIERDFRSIVPTLLDRPKEEIALTLEMLVRAYDPCISCSVHLLNVEFV
ncbi:MAG: Ni/Fe hydrogenase subunit alpha [Chloroflexi bacterium]|nr:Ni/Fe hydrogenase subunit alpha [Chloroflexota bacterium]MCL5075441.1 Ni/Fe hydrogenase subunit alpha [Chloroflexota bacterium]